MIGDILAAELSHMQPYIQFCSCQIDGATLLQTRIDNEPDFKTFLKVRCGEEGWRSRGKYSQNGGRDILGLPCDCC